MSSTWGRGMRPPVMICYQTAWEDICGGMRPGRLGSFPCLSWEQVDGFQTDLFFPINLGMEPRCWASRSGAGLALGDGVSNGRKKISPEEPTLLLSWGSVNQHRGWTPAIFSHSARIGFPLLCGSQLQFFSLSTQALRIVSVIALILLGSSERERT